MKIQMYKGFKTERAFYNCKLHGLANIIAGGGAGDFLKEEVIKIMGKRTSPPAMSLDDKTFGFAVTSGVRDLTDPEAKGLYFKLVNVTRNIKENMKVTREILGTDTGNKISDLQRKKIIKITKYNFGWSLQVTFSKILEFCPELGKRLTPWQIQNTKIQYLYNLLTKQQAGKIIKRLESIERKNKEVTK
jgi:hypothetical protein